MRHQRYLFILLASLLFANTSYAGKVLKTTGKKVFIIFSPEEEGTFANNDIFYLTDSSGKKTGVVQLKKIKGFKAVAVLGKGKAQRGDVTIFKGAGKKSKKSKSSSSNVAENNNSEEASERPSRRRNKMSIKMGVLFGYGSAKQDVNQGTSTSNQTGSSLGLRGAFNYPFSQSLELQLLGGLEMFKVEGEGTLPDNSGTGTIGTDINYLGLDALIKWEAFGSDSFGVKLIGGVGIYHPMSSSSTAISSIATVALGEFGLGVEYRAGNFSIPVDFIYYYFPSGGDVTSKLMGLRLGILF